MRRRIVQSAQFEGNFTVNHSGEEWRGLAPNHCFAVLLYQWSQVDPLDACKGVDAAVHRMFNEMKTSFGPAPKAGHQNVDNVQRRAHKPKLIVGLAAVHFPAKHKRVTKKS